MEVSVSTQAKKASSDTLNRLAKCAQLIDDYAVQIRSISSSLDVALRQIESESEDALSELKSNLSVIQSFIKIARANASKIEECPHAIPYDRAALARIQVLINNRSKSDEHASDLYYQATGQQKSLESAIGSLSEDAQKKEHQVRERFQAQLHECMRKKASANAQYAEILREPFFEEIAKERRYIESASPRSTSLSSVDSAVIGFSSQDVRLPSELDSNLLHRVESTESLLSREGRYSIELPVQIKYGMGGSILIQASEYPEAIIDKGMQSVILETLSEIGSQVERFDFLDPINLNSSALGIAAELTHGEKPMILPAPMTKEELSARVREIDAYYASIERKADDGPVGSMRSILYLKHFPEGYDSNTISLVRRVCRNAVRYGAFVLLSGKGSSKALGSTNEAIADISQYSTVISCTSITGLVVTSNDVVISGFVFRDGPLEIPTSLMQEAQHRLSLAHVDNRYVSQIPSKVFESLLFKRRRGLVNLPMGLDESGNIVSVSLEDENFATFICGASRSGKSTLLHTLLSDVFLSKHPDEVEVWLVDFKMTELSRYASSLPPHIKYLILDESPELVYDLIDKLMDNLSWRQNRFKARGWEKIEDAWRSGQYMPELLLVIDEFSVMSKIIADSVLAGKDYRDKMQLLLSKGAALGFRFIFASQGFTKGTRGLSEYSKDQIQQRIAMKTTYEEIKSTLDLPDISPSDKMEMEELDRHYALLKVPYGYEGTPSRLKKIHVLFFESREEQLQLLSDRLGSFMPCQRPNKDDPRLYVEKHPIIIDGNEHKDFVTASADISAGIKDAKARSFDDSSIYICIGEPRRMRTFSPIELVANHRENILILSTLSDGVSVQSMVASAVKGISYQEAAVHLCMNRQNQFLSSQLVSGLDYASRCLDVSSTCQLISRVVKSIDDGKHGNELIILFDVDTLFEDLAFAKQPAAIQQQQDVGRRSAGTPDLRTQLAMLKGEIVGTTQAQEDKQVIDASVHVEYTSQGEESMYDARDDVRYVISQGPRMGYHVMLVASDLQTLKDTRIDQRMFNHKVLFRNQKANVRGIVSNADLSVLSDVDSGSYRYTNGVDGVTYRPYAHSDFGILVSKTDELEDFYYAG